MNVLEAEGLRKSFGGVAAVDGVSFTVAAGEMLALIGPNGAGKSTCFDLVGGQQRADAGRVRLAGRDITALSARARVRAGLGRTFQIAAPFASMTACENVQLTLHAHAGRIWRLWRPAAAGFRAPALELLAAVEMSGLADRPAGALAYGDLKRLDLALALAGAPAVLLMDEPTAGVAPDARPALMALVRRLAARRGLAVLFTEHDMEVVFGVADRVLVLQRGALIAAGAPAEIRADPAVQAAYLGVAP